MTRTPDAIARTPICLNECGQGALFDLFQNMANPYVGLTAHIDISGFLKRKEQTGMPFFLRFLYDATAAANDVPELRRRIENGGVAEYEHCMASCTVARENGDFAFLNIDCQRPWHEFLPIARRAMETAKRQPGLDTSMDSEPMFFMSCLPWLYYTQLTQPTPLPADSVPRITWGKWEMRDGAPRVPVTLLAHHALVDGAHAALFFSRLSARLNADPAPDAGA